MYPKIYRYDKINGQSFEKNHRYDKINRLSFKKFIATIKLTDLVSKNLSLR
jgi:hypothetical protein